MYVYFFLKAGKKQLAGNTACEVTTHEVIGLKKEYEHLKQLVSEMLYRIGFLEKV